MKFTLSWLKEHLDTTASLQEIVDTMTMVGLEVEEVHDPADLYAPFFVAEIREAHPHPDADKLRVCKVDTGTEVLEVVCGAPNARTGLKGIFAPVGTQPPNVDFMLEKRKIRGIVSNGMMASEREMGLSDEHDGIIELENDYALGTPMADVYGLNDPVIDFEVTPNRPDWNGVVGIARDLAAAGLGTLKSKAIDAIEGTFESPMGIELKFDADKADACPLFAGRLVKGVKNGPSPEWLQKQLRAIGLRPINALADITNYISYDRARPLHVYDYDKLKGTIHARLGAKGEKYLALDGNEYEADENMCVIADDSGVLGFGGIMGGEDSGCSDETVNVFIESAYFDPIRTAQTGRRTGIVSDARYRFERGVDPEFVIPGLDQATAMVLEICGGEASHKVIAGDVPDHRRAVNFRPSRVKQLTGIDMAEDEMVRILGILGFEETKSGDSYSVDVPTWRPDIEGEADIVEEVARTYGFDHMPAVPLDREHVVARPVLKPNQLRARWSRRALANRGMKEAITYSFTNQDWAKAFGGGADELQLSNPISSELATMRPSLLPNLVGALGRNLARGENEVALFEVGPVYGGDEPGDQANVAGSVRAGGALRHWTGKAQAPDVFAAKADALAVLEECGGPTGSIQVTADAPSWYHPGRSGILRLGPKNALAYFGELHPRVLKLMDVKGPVAAFEVFFENIPPARKKATKAKGAMDASDLMPLERDFAFVVDSSVAAETMLRAARGAEKKLIADVAIFDVFEGESIGADKKSVAMSVKIQPREKTLTDKEIDAISDKVVAQVKKATGGELRG